MGAYCDQSTREWFEQAASERGAKLDIGKACVRFRNLGDLPLYLAGEAVSRIPVEQYIRVYEEGRSGD
jgi:hypothetical protein